MRIPGSLRPLVDGAGTVTVEIGGTGAVTVGAVLDALAGGHPALERRVRDERGRTRTHVNLFVGPDDVRDLAGLETTMAAGQELSIIPAISGG